MNPSAFLLPPVLSPRLPQAPWEPQPVCCCAGPSLPLLEPLGVPTGAPFVNSQPCLLVVVLHAPLVLVEHLSLPFPLSSYCIAIIMAVVEIFISSTIVLIIIAIVIIMVILIAIEMWGVSMSLLPRPLIGVALEEGGSGSLHTQCFWRPV